MTCIPDSLITQLQQAVPRALMHWAWQGWCHHPGTIVPGLAIAASQIIASFLSECRTQRADLISSLNFLFLCIWNGSVEITPVWNLAERKKKKKGQRVVLFSAIFDPWVLSGAFTFCAAIVPLGKLSCQSKLSCLGCKLPRLIAAQWHLVLCYLCLQAEDWSHVSAFPIWLTPNRSSLAWLIFAPLEQHLGSTEILFHALVLVTMSVSFDWIRSADIRVYFLGFRAGWRCYQSFTLAKSNFGATSHPWCESAIEALGRDEGDIPGAWHQSSCKQWGSPALSLCQVSVSQGITWVSLCLLHYSYFPGFFHHLWYFKHLLAWM